ncbi:MAG: multiheme c-type cytochrome [candidate division KSB1 bacterium]|nr:multiheme c-type cytochrome [candidate division KSB1 bacterium]
MRNPKLLLIVGALLISCPSSEVFGSGEPCVSCHSRPDVTPTQVRDWQVSRHAQSGVTCEICHSAEHRSVDDAAKAKLPTPEVCANCHPEQVEQFRRGKHALAWTAMEAMPATHYQPMELTVGVKGCGGCHKIGLKSEAKIRELKGQGFQHGVASCDACHTRHSFSVAEAKEPEACATCHMGFDHPQWEMYSTSKHGIRYQLRRAGKLPPDAAAPTCQTCHMPGGDHEVRTAWGFLALRLPLPEDRKWADDRVTVLKGLGVLSPDGSPTARLEAVKLADMARLDQASWDRERGRILNVCSQCHSRSFAQNELEKADHLIRSADSLMAEGVRTVADLYARGKLKKPEPYAYPYPDLLFFHEARTPIEQDLFRMFLEHRMRTFQGAFHANPDYAFWYGWSEMVADLTRIREAAGTISSANPR